MSTTTNATDTTIVRYDVITDGGTAPSYRDRDFARIVARRNRAGVLSHIEVVVTWAGHEGRARVFGTYTIDVLTETADYPGGVLAAVEEADTEALASLIRSATRAHTEAIDNNMEITDYTAVRATVAAALGEEPHHSIPATRQEAIEWRSHFVDEDFVGIVRA